jgi:hypothetical protein
LNGARLLPLLSIPLAWAIACSASGGGPTIGPGEFGGPGPPPSGFPTSLPPSSNRIDCQQDISAFCAAPTGSVPCVSSWSAAQSAAAWSMASTDGCGLVATQLCAGFLIAEPDFSPTNTDIRYFFDPKTGALVAIVALSDPSSSQCLGGPAGFTNPLVLDCQPPEVLVCPSDGGPPDASASDAQAIDAPLVDAGGDGD